MLYSHLLISFLGPLWSFDIQNIVSTSSQSNVYHGSRSVSLDIAHLFNNIATGPRADFDGNGGKFADQFLPTGPIDIDGVTFSLPREWGSDQDNVLADQQTIQMPQTVQFAREMKILYAGDWIDGESGAQFTFNFVDGSTQVVEASIHNWWNLHWINVNGLFRAPYHITSTGLNNNLTQIYTWSTSINTISPLQNITLPNASWPNRLHIFAISLVPDDISAPAGPSIGIRRTKLTTKWRVINGVKAYAVYVTIMNTVPAAAISASGPNDATYWCDAEYLVQYQSETLRTVESGRFRRLMPSDEIVVKIWVVPRKKRSFWKMSTQRVFGWDGGEDGGRMVNEDEGDIVISKREGKSRQIVLRESVKTDAGTKQSGGTKVGSVGVDLLERDTPEWWDDAKFGIFMHWGIYSVPGWAPPGVYAEWYWYHQHHYDMDPNSFWTYHLKTYGKDFVYDDFIPQFGHAYNASFVVDLIAESGAKYFIPTTKHHDGFAIFDTENSTHRSSVYLGPKRDYLRELFSYAKDAHPELHRGTYFSMPEWYNPDAGPYGFGTWVGERARNAYNTSKVEPYTGRISGRDYLRDEQLAQMKILAKEYETEIMWCDIGGPNLTRSFVEEWHPFADTKGLQVVMNNRCGTLPQFDTPEYTRFASIQPSGKWETSEGIDPYSYGYNHGTKPNDYRSVKDIIGSIVDISSKNGNYLLNIGPDGAGNIPQPMVDRLRSVGKWLSHSGTCIYGTDYFFPGAQLDTLRFTQTRSTFCIIALERPNDGIVIIDATTIRIPLLAGDTVHLLGAGKEKRGLLLQWGYHDGKYIIQVGDEVLDKVEWAWAFEVTYHQLRAHE